MAGRKKTAKKAKKKIASKAVKKRFNRKSVLERLIRKPMAELVRTGGLVSEAITVKVQRDLVKKGRFVGPTFDPTLAGKAPKGEPRNIKAVRQANIAKAREARMRKRMHGPILDPQHASQLRIMREAGII